MRVCPQCAWENPDLAAFCTNCGTALERVSSPGEKAPWRFRAAQGSEPLNPDTDSTGVSGQESLKTEAAVPKTADLPVEDDVLVTRAETGSVTESLIGDLNKAQTAITLGMGDGVQVATAVDMPRLDIESTAREGLAEVLPTNPEMPEMTGRSIQGGRTLVELTAPDVVALSKGRMSENLEQGASPAMPRETVALSSASMGSEKPLVSDAQASAEAEIGTSVNVPGTQKRENQLESEPDGPSFVQEESDPRTRLRSVLSRVMATGSDALETETSQQSMPAASATATDSSPGDEFDEEIEPSARSGPNIATQGEMESMDFAVESLDGEDSLSELSHALIQKTDSRAVSVNAQDMAEILTTRDLQPVDVHSPEGLAAAVAALNQPSAKGSALLSPPSSSDGKAADKVRYVLRMVGDATGDARVVSLGNSPVIIGRVEGEVRLADDDFLSPKHLMLTQQEDGVLVEDLDSLNGVWLRLRPAARIDAGDEVLLGEQRFLVAPNEADQLQPQTADGTRRLGVALGPSQMKLIRMSSSGRDGGQWPVPDAGFRVGRVYGELVFNSDRLMSGTHALFVRGAQGMECHDLGSTNGSWIRLRKKTLLSYGDCLLVGRSVWRFGRPAL